MEEKKTPAYGDIVSVGITKDNQIQVEFWSNGINGQLTESLFLDKHNCEKITGLMKVVEGLSNGEAS